MMYLIDTNIWLEILLDQSLPSLNNGKNKRQQNQKWQKWERSPLHHPTKPRQLR